MNCRAALSAVALVVGAFFAGAAGAEEPPMLAGDVAAGKLPQLGEGIGKAIKGFKKSVHEADAIEAEAQALAAQQQAAAPAQAITAAPVQSMTVDQPAAVAQPASRA